MRKIKAYYIDPVNNIAEAREITPTLDTYYELIHTDVIDIVNRGFTNSKSRFDIICDDEGLLKDSPYISAIDERMQPMLVGALLVTGEADSHGELTSLTDDDVRLLKRNTRLLKTRKHPDGYRLLTHMTY